MTDSDLRRFLEAVAAPLCVLDGSTIRECNTRFARLVGWSTEGLSGKPWAAVVQGDPPAVSDTEAFTLALLPKQQPVRTVRASLQPFGDAGFRLLTLHPWEESCERTLARLPDIFYRTDPEGILIALSPACEVMLGYSPEELLGRRLSDLYANPEDRAEVLVRLAAAAGRPVLVEAQLNHKDGHLVWVASHSYLLFDSAGNVVGVEGLARDVSAQKELEQQLRDDNERRRRIQAELSAQRSYLEGLLEQVPVGVMVASAPNGAITIANTVASRLLGTKPRSIRSLHEYSEYPVYDLQGRRLAAHEFPLVRALTQGEVLTGAELRYVRPDGEALTFDVNASPVRDATGGILGAIITFFDISERKAGQLALERERAVLREANARLERSNAELEAFAYAASHDLKAPLRAVASLAAILEDDLERQLDGHSRTLLKLLQTRTERMDRMVNGLLNYARLGRERTATEPVDVGELLRELLEMLNLPEGFTVVLPDTLPRIETVRLHLAQVFQNLLVNAVTHHDRATGQVAIGCRRLPAGWEFSVADDGPGIPAEHRRSVFRIFNILDLRDQTEHTGVGLAIVRKLVLEHGGDIEVTANRPRGSLFVFTWPDSEPAESVHSEDGAPAL